MIQKRPWTSGLRFGIILTLEFWEDGKEYYDFKYIPTYGVGRLAIKYAIRAFEEDERAVYAVVLCENTGEVAAEVNCDYPWRLESWQHPYVIVRYYVGVSQAHGEKKATRNVWIHDKRVEEVT
jgi:hypothetical protein